MLKNNLKARYESACNEYLQIFCDKQELTNEGWVNQNIGDIVLCSDMYFNLTDIILDIETNQPKGKIIEWYDESLENPDKAINYYSFTKGLRASEVGNKSSIKCPECLKTVRQKELDMFGGLCEKCSTGI